MKKVIGVALAAMILTTGAAYAKTTITAKVVGGVIVLAATAGAIAAGPVTVVFAAGTAVGGMVAGKEIDVMCSDVDLRRKVTDPTYAAVVDAVCE